MLKEVFVRSCIMLPDDEGVEETEGALNKLINVEVPPESMS
jgi:hypothetical protein